jgi:hypothetical protein
MRWFCKIPAPAAISGFFAFFLFLPGAFAGQKDPLPVWPHQAKFLYQHGPGSGNGADAISLLPVRPDEVKPFQEDGWWNVNLTDPVGPFPVNPDEVKFFHKHHRGQGHGVDPISPTPEPMTLVLFGSGLVFIGGALRRRNRKRSIEAALTGSDLPKGSSSPVAESSKC